MTRSHGGKRGGAGRKPIPPEQRKVLISAAIAPETDAIIKANRRDKEPLGAVLDRLIALTHEQAK